MWLEQFLQDMRYAWRGLLQSWVFAATTVATLAIGIGLSTVAFTVFDAYVLRPFAVRDPSRLYSIGWRSRDSGSQTFQWSEYRDLEDRRDLFEGVVAERTRFVSSEGRSLAAAYVSSNYFAVLAPRMLLGRGLTVSDESADVAVLSHGAWTRLLGGGAAAVGGSIDINGRRVVVVGVLGPEFGGVDDMPRDVWLPITSVESAAGVEMIARLRPAVSVARVETALAGYVARLAAVRGGEARALLEPRSTPNPLSVGLLAVLAPVFAAFGLVLVAACANVSNVMLARAVARHREIAVRLSIGAGRWRVVRQLLTEGALIAALAGAAGLLLAYWALRAGVVLIFSTLPPSVAALLRVVPLTIDWRVFVFALAISTLASLLFALLPALHASRVSLTDALRGISAGAGRGSRLRGVLVAGQVAVSIVLVVAATTLARNGSALGSIDLGYSTAGVTSINVRGEDRAGLIGRISSELMADARVGDVAAVGGTPLIVRTRAVAAAPEGTSVARGTRYTFVSPEYFSLLRIPIVRGRGFTDAEATGGTSAIVSAATANAFWPGQDPLGRTIRIEPADGRPVDTLSGYSRLVVVGVVRDVVSGILVDGIDAGHIYLPTEASNPRATALLVRGRARESLPATALQEIFRRVTADPEALEAIPLEEMRALQVYPLLAASFVGSALGAIALVLSISGLYGVLVYTLSQRTREIGIRMALGATAAAVVKLVIGQCGRLAGTGAAIGTAATAAVMMILGSHVRLREVSFVDAGAFAIGFLVVGAATILAAYHPARRATRVDPAQALRAEG